MAVVENVIKIYQAVTKFPAPKFAEVLKSDGKFVSVLSKWSQSNVETGKKIYSQQIFLLDDSLSKIQDFPSVDISNEIISSLSPCGTLKAVVRESLQAGKESQQLLEVWNGHQIQLNCNLSALDIHGSVYSEADFASLVWSASGDKIAYIAEEKVPKSEPFLPAKKRDADSEKPLSQGAQFELRPDWGEQLVGRHQPVIVTCDVKIGAKPTLLQGLPPNLSPAQLLWTPDGNNLIGVAWESTPRRLGLVYCTNRPSHVFQISTDGSYRTLSGAGSAVCSPRCNPNGSQVVWLERKSGGPHHGGMKLMSCNLLTGKTQTLVNLVEECLTLESGDKFYGLYCSSLPRRCWTRDGKYIILDSPQIDKVVPFLVDAETGSISLLDKMQPTGESRAIFDVWCDIVVCITSSMRMPHSLLISKLNFSSSESFVDYKPLSTVEQPSEFAALKCDSLILEAQVPDAYGRKFNALYMGPSNGTTRSLPLIVWPHGGPHSAFMSDYKAEAMFFGLLGFGVLMVNYRGSIGFGEASVNSLPGHVGDNDVSDMQQAVNEALTKFPQLNKEHCVLFGGSHGGFLVTHLSGQFPDFYRAVVARNPVTDIASMFPISDIPDWSAVECGWDLEDIGPRSTEQLVQMRRKSPLWYACDVKAPTLLLVGSCDLRVPASQSLQYYYQLKKQGTPVKLHMYEDNHPLGKVPNSVDNIINSALWFIQHTSLD